MLAKLTLVRWAVSAAISVVVLIVALVIGIAVVLSPGWSSATANLDPKAPVPSQYLELIRKAGSFCPTITPPVIAADLEAESNFNERAVSPKGARGIAQFMPATWAEEGLDGDADGIADPFNPADAIPSQGSYLCKLAALVAPLGGDNLSFTLAAYNAGYGRVLDCRCVPVNGQTEVYVAKILSRLSVFSGVALGNDPVSGDSGAVVAAGSKWLGVPYVWGGGSLTGPTGQGRDGRGPGFDCSGLTRIAYYQASGGKIDLPRVSSDQARQGVPIPSNLTAMKPGDLIAFSLNGGGIDHVGIYAGQGKMLHAPRTGKNVEITDLTTSYWTSKPWTVRRLMA